MRGVAADGALLAAIFLAAVLTRVPFAGTYLTNWDAVQYALGLVDFDIARHQPHPPGSVLYVALGRLVLPILGEASRALTAISIVAGAAGAALCYLAVGLIFGRRTGAVATVIYLTSPLTWFYGTAPLPYALEGSLVLGVVILLWWGAEAGRLAPALGASLLLGIAGGVRQTTLALLLPLWLVATWRAAGGAWPPVGLSDRGDHSGAQGVPGRRPIWLAARGLLIGLLTLGGVGLAWAIPLIVLAGGPAAYLTASRRLSTLASSQTSFFSAGLPAMAGNVSYLWDVVVTGLHLSLVPLVAFLWWRRRQPCRVSPGKGWFLALWAVPALVVYSVMHVGQAGYLLMVWPLACAGVAAPATALADELSHRWPACRRRAVSLLTTVLGLAGCLLFLASPLVDSGTGGLGWSQIRRHDRFWQGLTTWAGGMAPGELVVLTGTQTRESFRLATYYLPQHPVYAIGLDRHGELGVAFTGQWGRHSYAEFMAGAPAERAVSFPEGTRRLVILDRSLAGLFPSGSLAELAVTPERRVWLWPAVSSGSDLSHLTFRSPIDVE